MVKRDRSHHVLSDREFRVSEYFWASIPCSVSDRLKWKHQSDLVRCHWCGQEFFTAFTVCRHFAIWNHPSSHLLSCLSSKNLRGTGAEYPAEWERGRVRPTLWHTGRFLPVMGTAHINMKSDWIMKWNQFRYAEKIKSQWLSPVITELGRPGCYLLLLIGRTMLILLRVAISVFQCVQPCPFSIILCQSQEDDVSILNSKYKAVIAFVVFPRGETVVT